MSSLPPYSTYRTDNKQMMYPQAISHGNVLTFTPPGFKQTLNVKFPDCRLAVCEKCKKNYKTRDMCRVRNSHTAEPWTTAYICITLDDTCTDSDGKYIDKPLTVRMVQWQPFCVKKPFESKTPVCSACKKTNRTRSFCRERHKHRQLPWCTVYVLLSALESTDPATVVAAPSKPAVAGEGKPENEDKPEGENTKAVSPGKENDTPENDAEDTQADKVTSAGTDESKETADKKDPCGNLDEGDDINEIAESRTFLAQVSCHASTVHWLELAEFDAAEANSIHGLVAPDSNMQALYAMRPGPPGVAVPAIDPAQAQYYAQAMGYHAQQHQQALKSNQQYYFQMQQRQQQHYQWQAQYNQQPGHPQQPAAGSAPPVQSGGGVAGQPAAAPVTAGEAAAQQQKQNNAAPAVIVPAQQPQIGQEQTAGAAAAAAAAQQQANPQWQAQMMYHQQYYNQQQLQQMQQPQAPGALQQEQPTQQQVAAVAPQQQQQYAPAQAPEIAQAPNGVPQIPPGDELAQAAVADGEGGENVAKRTRYV